MADYTEFLKVKGYMTKQMYPKPPAPMLSGEYSIIKICITEVIEGELHPRAKNKMNEVSIKGNLPLIEPYEDMEFTLELDEVHEIYGASYNIRFSKTIYEFKKPSDLKIFLSKILTETQIKNLFDKYPNPLEIFQSSDIDKLTQVKGIGETTAERIMQKYMSTLDYAEVYVELDGMGVTPKMIKKLVDEFGSPDIVIQRVKGNPYILTELDGIGFKKADIIAMRLGIPEDSVDRLEAFIIYTLTEWAEDGYTWVSSGALVDAIENNLYDYDMEVIADVVKSLKDREVLHDSEFGIIALKKYYNLEKSIAKELDRIKRGSDEQDRYNGWEDRIAIAEKMNGWEYTAEQKKAIEDVINESLVVITGKAGCVDSETEYFNGKGWVKISEYREGDKVLQYTSSGKAELVLPYHYIKEPCEDMWFVNSETNHVNQMLSDDHDFAYRTSKGHLQKKNILEVKAMHESGTQGFSGRIVNSFQYGGSGIPMSDDEIRLKIAVLADGHFPPSCASTNLCVIRIKKERKKKRLEEILLRLNKEYTKAEAKPEGYHRYSFYMDNPEKTYEHYWYNCSQHQLEVVVSEVLEWDGSQGDSGRRRWSSTHKTDADFIQFAFSACGYSTTLNVNDRRGRIREIGGKEYVTKSIDYEVTPSIKKGRTSSICGRTKATATIDRVKSTDGYKYCFTVDSGYLVLRREGRIFVTGNCGKTSTVLGGLKALGDNIIFAQCSLSGKAAARMTESTGYEAYTIHRLLGFNPTSENENKSPFSYNENNPLPHDVIIVDEFPMIGGSLFLSLIKAVPTGAKLILLGDPAQLSSIGSLNIGSDIINSGFIKVAMLTKIHRQASKSAIITDSLQISAGIEFLDKDFTGIEIRGELQDFEVDIYDNKMSTVGKILKHFKEKLELSGNDIMEVQVIVPLNSRGEASVARLNPLLQDIYNPYSDDKKQIEAKFSKDDTTIFRVGDKVMNIKNNYKLMEYIDVNEFDYNDIFSFDSPTENTPKPVQVFNGYLGTLVDIKENNDLIIYFPLVDKNVVVPMSHWHKKRGIVLGYAAGVHKSQGSGFKYPIVGIDYSHYVMLSRQLVYTAITRAIKHCVLIAERKALQYAISQSAIEYKQTFLKEMLNNLQINKENPNESN